MGGACKVGRAQWEGHARWVGHNGRGMQGG